MSYSYGRGYKKEPWQDTMQVCLNGCVINASFHKSPQNNKDFCDSCGEKTITNCPQCDKPIPGDRQDTGLVSLLPRSAPDFCKSCGKPFPWKSKKEAKRLEAEAEKPIEALQRICSNFHSIVRRLRKRYRSRETLDVTDEYDVQNLLSALLVLYFDDIRPEEWTPSYAGKSARIDFLLKQEKIVVEVKMTRKGLTDGKIGDQLIVDVERYKEHPDCDTLICFIYDPEGRITNPQGLSGDLQSQINGQSKSHSPYRAFVNYIKRSLYTFRFLQN